MEKIELKCNFYDYPEDERRADWISADIEFIKAELEKLTIVEVGAIITIDPSEFDIISTRNKTSYVRPPLESYVIFLLEDTSQLGYFQTIDLDKIEMAIKNNPENESKYWIEFTL